MEPATEAAPTVTLETFLNLSPEGFEGAVDGHPFTLGHDYSVLWLDQRPKGTPDALVQEMLRSQIAEYLGSENRAKHFLDYLEHLGANRMGFLIGRLPKTAKDGDDGPIYYDRSDTHLLTFGQTGSGKFRCNIAPTCLEYRGPVVSIDPKGEAAMVAARARYERHGQIPYILDPFGVIEEKQGQLPKWAQLVSYNPLMDLDPKHKNFEIDAGRLATAMLWTAPGSDSYWRNNGQKLLKGLLMHVRTFPGIVSRDLNTVIDYLGMGEIVEYLDLFDDMQKSEVEAVRRCGRFMSGPAKETPKQFMTFVSDVDANLNYMDSPAMKKILTDGHGERFTLSNVLRNALLGDITPEDIKAFSNRLPASPHRDNFIELLSCGGGSLFIVFPQDFVKELAGWLRLIINSLLSVSARHKRFGPPVALILDEVAQLGELESLGAAYGIARGNNVRIWSFWQARGTVAEIYKTGQSAILNNSITIGLTFDDFETAERFSKIEGDEIKFIETGHSVSAATSTSETESKNRGHSTGGGTGDSLNLAAPLSNGGGGGSRSSNKNWGEQTGEGTAKTTASTHSKNTVISRVVEPVVRPSDIMKRVAKGKPEALVRQSGCSIFVKKVLYDMEPFSVFADPDPWVEKRWL